MERNEMIEVLMGKANVSREEAEEALEKCNDDVLDAIVYLERIQEKLENLLTVYFILMNIKKLIMIKMK